MCLSLLLSLVWGASSLPDARLEAVPVADSFVQELSGRDEEDECLQETSRPQEDAGEETVTAEVCLGKSTRHVRRNAGQSSVEGGCRLRNKIGSLPAEGALGDCCAVQLGGPTTSLLR